MKDRLEPGKVGVVVLAGTTKMKKGAGGKKRSGALYRLLRPSLWTASKQELESTLSSRINQDDYIVGQNKPLLYLHPTLTAQKNLNFLKKGLYFAGKTGDRMYRKRKHELMDFLSISGKTPVSLVLRAAIRCPDVDPAMIAVVGPRRQLENEVKRSGIEGVLIAEQVGSIGENILKGKQTLVKAGYRGRWVLVLGADVPLITPKAISKFIEAALGRGSDADLVFGLGSRQELAEYIRRKGMTHLGPVGPNRPKRGHLNKFGFPFIDDIPLFGREGARVHMMVGNIFLYRASSMDSGFVDRFYSVRKMGSDPFAYPFLIKHFASTILKGLRWKLPASEGESVLKRMTGVKVLFCPVMPQVILDMDSYTDLRRLSAIYFHGKEIDEDLEVDFREYLRERKGKGRRHRRRQKVH